MLGRDKPAVLAQLEAEAVSPMIFVASVASEDLRQAVNVVTALPMIFVNT